MNAYNLRLADRHQECIDQVNNILKLNFATYLRDFYSASSLRSKALAQQYLGNVFEAEINHKLSMAYGVHTENKKDQLLAKSNLSSLHIKWKEPQEALKTTIGFLSDYDTAMVDPEFSLLMNNLAESYSRNGDYTLASEVFDHIISNINIYSENKDFDPVITYRNYGRLWMCQHETERALKLLEQALKQSQPHHGNKHFQTSMCQFYLGLCYSQQGSHTQALQAFDSAIEIITNTYQSEVSQFFLSSVGIEAIELGILSTLRCN